MESIVFEKVRIRNFFSVGEDEVELEYTPGINTIQGKNYDENESNGAGKTVILCEAPLWCLFGVLMRNRLSATSIINENVRKGCEVSMWFRKNLKRYRVERKIPSELELYEISTDGTVELPAKLSSIDETQAKICRVLEADSDIYKNLVLFNINKTKPFSSEKLDNKRRIWEYVMNLGVYRDMGDEIKKGLGLNGTDIIVKSEIQRNRENELATAKSSRDTVVRDIELNRTGIERNRIEHKNAIEGIKKEVETKKQELDTKLRELEPTKVTKEREAERNFADCVKVLTERIQKRMLEDKEKLTRDTESLKKIEKDINTLVEIEKLLPEFQKKVEKAKELYLEKNKADKEGYGLVAKLKTKIEIKEDEKGSIAGLAPICPTCKREVPEAYKTEIIGKFNNEIGALSLELKTHMETVATTAKEVQELNAKYNEMSSKYNLYKQKVDGKSDLQRQKDTMDRSLSILRDSETLRTKEKTDEEERLQKALDTRKAELIRDFETRSAELAKMIGNVDADATAKRAMYERLLAGLDTDTASASLEKMLGNCIKAIEDRGRELDEVNAELDRLRAYADDYDYCKTILSDEGIKKYVIGIVLPSANQILRKYFADMETGYIAEFDDGLKEKYTKISNGRNRDYENFSEGEKKRIDMAMLLTFIDIGIMCGTLNSNLLIFDELLDTSADNSGTDKFMEILYKKAMEDNLSIWIISHRESIIGIPHNREILVAKRNDISFIERSKTT